MKNQTLDALSAVGSKATVAGASLTGWGWVVSNEFFGLMGVVIALCGLVMNLYYKYKSDRRVALEHAARMAERQMRLDLMRATQQPIMAPTESDYARLDEAA